MSDVKSPYLLPSTGRVYFVPVPAVNAARELPLLPLSEQEIIAQEWDHFQDILLSHVRKHQPLECAGMRGYPQVYACPICDEEYRKTEPPIPGTSPQMVGYNLRLMLELIEIKNGKEEHATDAEDDDGFDPDEWSGQAYDINSDPMARAHLNAFRHGG